LTDRKQGDIAFQQGGDRSGLPRVSFQEDAIRRAKMDRNPHVTFVCVRNRVRSTFAKFYLEDFLRKSGDKATVSSAGFVPQVLKDQLAGAEIAFPEPLFKTSMSRLTREFLFEKGIRVPEDWRSKELSAEMVDRADLLITALAAQKEELCEIYKEACFKIFSIREMSEKTGYLFSEDFSALPLDQNYWYYAEEDPRHVSKVLLEWEQSLISAIPNITKRLGMHKNGSLTSSDE
jgi:protein-tyrosine-phosphatase